MRPVKIPLKFWIMIIAAVTGIMLLSFAGHAIQKARRGHISDFEAYYVAATALHEHQDPYVFAEKPYIYPPLFATLLMPLANLPANTAAMLYVPLMLSAIILAFYLGLRELTRRLGFSSSPFRLALSFLFAFLIMEDRIKSDLQMFQVNSLLLCLLLLALYWLDKRPLMAGISLGLAMNIKAFPVIIFPYLLVRRRYLAALSMLAATVCFGLCPALIIGWTRNLQYLAQSSAGFLSLLGIQTEVHHKAQILGVTASYSVSLPSGIVRMAGPGNEVLAWTCIALILAGFAIFGAWLYHKNRLPLIRWPRNMVQQQQPWKALIAMEWVILITLSLIFSPQTNSRHFLMLAMTAMFAAIIMVHCFRQPRWMPVFFGTILLWAGLTLPPGSFEIPILTAAHHFWQFVGGPSWVLLASLIFLTWAGTTIVRKMTA